MRMPRVLETPVDANALLSMGGGAAAMGTLDGILETIFAMDPTGWRKKFPFLVIDSHIPPLDNWLLALIPSGVLAAGIKFTNPLLAFFGLGGLAYGGGALLKDFLQRNIGYLVAALQTTSKQYADGAKRIIPQIGTYA